MNRATTYSVDGMIFRQSSAFKIINGKVEWRFKKCRFSVTRTSAPLHSTYATIKASAGFSPIASYFAPNSKGTTKSSSISVKLLMNSINSMYSSAVKWRRTSSVINRGIRIACFGNVSRIVSRRTSQEAFFEIPKAKIYSFESRTNSKLFIPKFFSCFTDNLNYFFFFHVHKRRFFTGCKLSKFVYVRFCPSYIWLFHVGSPPRSTLYHKGKGRSKKKTCSFRIPGNVRPECHGVARRGARSDTGNPINLATTLGVWGRLFLLQIAQLALVSKSQDDTNDAYYTQNYECYIKV